MASGRTGSQPVRVFIGLTEISGYGTNLKRGFVELGVGVSFIDLSPPTFRFGGDNPPTRLTRLFQHAARRRATIPRSDVAGKLVWRGLQTLLAPFVFCWAIARHDAFVFLYGSSFFGFRELPILTLLRRRVVYVDCGSDVRPSYLDGSEMSHERGLTIVDCVRNTRRKKRAVGRMERHATAIVSHPAYGLLHERSFTSFLAVGIPRSVVLKPPRPVRNRAVRILHAPSHPAAKGTPRVREAIEKVRGRGREIDYVELTGVPNEVVLDELAQCDFVVDSVYSDTPIAGFAADAALFGKPAVVGGYAWDELRRFTPPDDFPPSHCCDPGELEGAIERLIDDEAYRTELGRAAHEFVIRRWSARAVAKRFLQLFAGTAPEEWTCDPRAIRYVGGWGQSQERSRELTRAVIDGFGSAALQLADKPELELLYLEFAGAHNTEPHDTAV